MRRTSRRAGWIGVRHFKKRAFRRFVDLPVEQRFDAGLTRRAWLRSEVVAACDSHPGKTLAEIIGFHWVQVSGLSKKLAGCHPRRGVKWHYSRSLLCPSITHGDKSIAIAVSSFGEGSCRVSPLGPG